MSYKNWNDTKELQCYVIFKCLEANYYPRGLQIKLSKELSKLSNLKFGSISAKVSNFKSLSKVNNKSNASNNSKRIYEKYKNYNLNELIELSSFNPNNFLR